MSVTDEEDKRCKALAYIGLVLLATAFGYSLGTKGATTEVGTRTIESPTSLHAFGMMTRAADAARESGDEQAASRFESAASLQRTRVMAWSAQVQADLASRSE